MWGKKTTLGSFEQGCGKEQCVTLAVRAEGYRAARGMIGFHCQREQRLKTLNSVQEEGYVSSLLSLCLMSRIPSAQEVERRPVRKETGRHNKPDETTGRPAGNGLICGFYFRTEGKAEKRDFST